MIKQIMIGNSYNIPISTWYCETQEEFDELLSTKPAGTFIEYNGEKFMFVCVKSDGTYNEV